MATLQNYFANSSLLEIQNINAIQTDIRQGSIMATIRITWGGKKLDCKEDWQDFDNEPKYFFFFLFLVPCLKQMAKNQYPKTLSAMES